MCKRRFYPLSSDGDKFLTISITQSLQVFKMQSARVVYNFYYTLGLVMEMYFIHSMLVSLSSSFLNRLWGHFLIYKIYLWRNEAT